MKGKKVRWQKECIRCGKEFVATGKCCRVCEECNTNKVGAKNIRIDKIVQKELNKIIEKSEMKLNYNNIIKGYIQTIKEFGLRDKLQNIIFRNKKKS